MALANVACLLAEQVGKEESILVVDWDLEAPGLHRFFPPRLSTPEIADLGLDPSPGLIDLFLDIEQALPPSTATSDESADAAVSSALSQVNIQRVISETAIPNVKILGAGRDDDGQYSSRVGTFNWESLFRRAPTIYQALAEQLARAHRYVLVDSRTGVTDISGICTTLLPEKLVVVFTPNRQSLTGVRQLIEKATSYRRNSDDLRPLMVFPLPSRIEASLEDLRAKWRFGDRDLGIVGYQPMFENLFKQVYGLPSCNLSPYFDEVQIQQTPDYAYGEEIAVRRGTDRFSLANSFRVFTQRLTSEAPPWTPVLVEPAQVVVQRDVNSPPIAPSTPAAPRAGQPTHRSAPEPPQVPYSVEPTKALATAPRRKSDKSQATKRRDAPRVFISYAHGDREQAEYIADWLESRGRRVWRSSFIEAGSDFRNEVAEALDSSDVVVVLWSKTSVTSRWVMAEAEEGLRRGVLLPVLLDDVPLPLGFREIQALDLRRDLRRDRDRALESLDEAVNRIAVASPGETRAATSAQSQKNAAGRRWGLMLAASVVTIMVITGGVLYFQRSPATPVDPPVRVPNFVGARTEDVLRTAQLLNLQLVMTDKTGRTFESLKGVVTSQNPPAESEIAKGGTVRLGVETAVVAVPTLVGTTLDQALNALLRAGLEFGTTQAVTVADAPDGTIVNQSPAAGATVPVGSRVNVSVARGRVGAAPSDRRAPRQEPVR